MKIRSAFVAGMLAAVAGPPYLAEGEMAVIEPLGGTDFRIVARITKDAWAPLLAAK